MTNYTFFDEVYYLESYPDVAEAVNAGEFLDGLEHFDLIGRYEGRYLVSPYYNEEAYLLKYPDVAEAVEEGYYSSGAQHLAEDGYDEGRYSPLGLPETGLFDTEEVYLRKYPDVAQAVRNGAFLSGYDHFLQYGLLEGRSPTYFNEQDYLLVNPDVANAIANPDPSYPLLSGFDHYFLFGQFEDREVLLGGTPGNDIITSFGSDAARVDITGVDYETISGSPFDYRLRSTGVGEIDTLIAQSSGGNDFLLGTSRSPSNPNPVQLYVGGNAADYAIIRNFVIGLDTIQLAGSIGDYSQEASGGNLSILTTATRDLVAVAEGVTNPLNQVFADPSAGTFSIG